MEAKNGFHLGAQIRRKSPRGWSRAVFEGPKVAQDAKKRGPKNCHFFGPPKNRGKSKKSGPRGSEEARRGVGARSAGQLFETGSARGGKEGLKTPPATIGKGRVYIISARPGPQARRITARTSTIRIPLGTGFDRIRKKLAEIRAPSRPP